MESGETSQGDWNKVFKDHQVVLAINCLGSLFLGILLAINALSHLKVRHYKNCKLRCLSSCQGPRFCQFCFERCAKLFTKFLSDQRNPNLTPACGCGELPLSSSQILFCLLYERTFRLSGSNQCQGTGSPSPPSTSTAVEPSQHPRPLPATHRSRLSIRANATANLRLLRDFQLCCDNAPCHQ